MKAEEIQIQSHQREELIDITALVNDYVRKSGMIDGIVALHVPHTTAALTINEGADPDVKKDILTKLKNVIPQDDGYQHSEGNSDAHIKSTLVGSSLQLIVAERNLILGRWQGIFFCEFDGPRTREIYFKAIAG